MRRIHAGELLEHYIFGVHVLDSDEWNVQARRRVCNVYREEERDISFLRVTESPLGTLVDL